MRLWIRTPLRRTLALLTIFSLVLVWAGAAKPSQSLAQSSQRCFSETNFCIDGRVREFWEQNGGLAVFGFPTGPQQQELIEGRPFQVQWFQRNRLELHPENGRPYDVLLGRLGGDRLAQQNRDWFTFPKSAPQAGCRFFAETGHNICGDILKAWHSSGLEFDGRRGKSEAENLGLFGMPLSDAQVEQIEGRDYLVQWFERARFEVHPENAPPYNVLLGLLGNEVRAGATTAPAAVGDACLDVPDPVSARIRPGKCGYQGEIFAFDISGFQPNEEIVYWFTMPDGTIFQSTGSGVIDSGPTGNGRDTTGDLFWITQEDEPFGLWSAVFQGKQSAHQAIIYFKVINAPHPPVPCPDVQDPVSARVHPGKCFSEGGILRMELFGFQPNEEVSYWFTGPDGAVYRGTHNHVSDAAGEIFTYYDTMGDAPGVWSIVHEGVASKHQSIIYYKVMGP